MTTHAHTARIAATILAALSALALLACGGGSGGHNPPGSLKLASASRQTGRPDTAVPDAPSVKVVDVYGNPVQGATVDFEVTAGGGAVTPASGTSGSDGIVRVAWTLGAGGPQSLRATTPTLPVASLTFSAQPLTGDGYKIDLRLLTTASDTQWAAFTSAAERIGQVVTGGPTPLDVTGRSCDGTPVSGQVEDLLILVRLRAIDGPRGILGQAGWCIVRSQAAGRFPAVGLMEFDTADLALLETEGLLGNTILHEMLHVVGFGTAWDFFPSLTAGAGTSTSRFLGAGALAAAIDVNKAPADWTSVPLENCGTTSPSPCGGGTQDSHWLEPTFKNELMTGWLSGRTQPLSRTTAGSLADMGYTVDLDAADFFDLSAVPAPALAAEPPALWLGDDVLHLPIQVVE